MKPVLAQNGLANIIIIILKMMGSFNFVRKSYIWWTTRALVTDLKCHVICPPPPQASPPVVYGTLAKNSKPVKHDAGSFQLHGEDNEKDRLVKDSFVISDVEL